MNGKHIITMVMTDSIGVLSRMIGLIARWGFCLDSLTVSSADAGGEACLSVVVIGPSRSVAIMTRQAARFEGVVTLCTLSDVSSSALPPDNPALQESVG